MNDNDFIDVLEKSVNRPLRKPYGSLPLCSEGFMTKRQKFWIKFWSLLISIAQFTVSLLFVALIPVVIQYFTLWDGVLCVLLWQLVVLTIIFERVFFGDRFQHPR